MKKLLLAAILLAFSGIASAEWEKLLFTDDAAYYLDRDNIKRISKGRVEIWQLVTYREKFESGVQSREFRMEFDCKKNKYRWTAILGFDGHMGAVGEGRLVEKSWEKQEWQAVPLGDRRLIQKVRAVACEGVTTLE